MRTAQNHIYKEGVQDILLSMSPFKIKEKIHWCDNSEANCPWGYEYSLMTDEEKTKYTEVETWFLYFNYRNGSALFGLMPILPYYVEISKKTGKVIDNGILK